MLGGRKRKYEIPLPAPYGRRELPQGWDTVPFVQLRSHLYPPFKDRVAPELGKQFVPFAFLPAAKGPFSHPVDGIRAVFQGQQRLRQLQARAVESGGMLDVGAFRPPQPLFEGFTPEYAPMPGFGIRELPFDVKNTARQSDMPAGPSVRQVLRKQPWLIGSQPTGLHGLAGLGVVDNPVPGWVLPAVLGGLVGLWAVWFSRKHPSRRRSA